MSSARESRSALPAGSSAVCQAPNMRARRSAETLSTSITSHWSTCPQVDHSACCVTEQTEETTKQSARRSSMRSEEHTSELQSRGHLVCRLLLEKKKATMKL